MIESARPTPSASVATLPKPEVRQAVKALLQGSAAFAQLPAATQQKIARDTALIADYLAAPEGIEGNTLPGGVGRPPARALAGERLARPADSVAAHSEAGWKAVDEIGGSQFTAGAAQQGVEVMGMLIDQVKFPDFVGSLIQGVFQAIVDASVQQMEAYAAMVEQVAKSLQQFRDENVTENQGRDHMVDRFPDLFEIGMDDMAETPGPRLKLREGVEESDALRRVNSSVQFEDGQLRSMDLSDENVEKSLVIAARTQLARQRQQLLASLVLLGINRIVVTDGRIQAKVLYEFQARDARKLQRSATAFDYATQGGRVATTWEGEGDYESGSKRSGQGSYEKDKGGDYDYSADYYSKGKYKYAQKPIVTAMSAASEASEATLSTRAQLAGTVEVNFKSDYLPLDKMATPGMVAAIQGNSTPVDPNVVPSARQPQAAAPAAPAPTPPA